MEISRFTDRQTCLAAPCPSRALPLPRLPLPRGSTSALERGHGASLTDLVASVVGDLAPDLHPPDDPGERLGSRLRQRTA
jgi:hypothetical protein